MAEKQRNHMPERDYQPAFPVPESPRFLLGTSIEIVRQIRINEPPCHALFDFDGTLSLIREGWVDIMVPMMVEKLLPFAKPNESEKEIEAYVREFVYQLTGKQTIYQMIQLASEIEAHGGVPLDPLEYKEEYHRRLLARIADRREGLAKGTLNAEDMLVPGAIEMLSALQNLGVQIYVASGTDEEYVFEEAHLLGIDKYADGKIYGARKDYWSFSKEMVIKRILEENSVDGSRLIAFGDGYVEIADCKAAGGISVGVASDEKNRSGKPDEWKRRRLIGAGADMIIPDFRETKQLLDYIWNSKGKADLER
jgi:phosphoglycolate phosphatase-like HAD superfamily hydrolase